MNDKDPKEKGGKQPEKKNINQEGKKIGEMQKQWEADQMESKVEREP